MRKIRLILTIVLLVTFSAVGCQQSEKEDPAPQKEGNEIIREPSSSETQYYATSAEIYQALSDPDSEYYADMDPETAEIMKAVFAQGTCEVYTPLWNGEPLKTGGVAEWQTNTVFSSELLGLPWIWHYVQYRDECVVISYAPLNAIRICHPEAEEITAEDTFAEVVKKSFPAFPNVDNASSFAESYSSIAKKQIRLADGAQVEAVVYTAADAGRVFYRFRLGNNLFSVWAYNNQTVTDDDFFAKLSFQAVG